MQDAYKGLLSKYRGEEGRAGQGGEYLTALAKLLGWICVCGYGGIAGVYVLLAVRGGCK